MRPTRHFGILSAVALRGTAALVSAAALGSTAALAHEPTDPPSLHVHYAQSDLQDSASAEALYRRIKHAARIVCEQPSPQEVEHYRLYKACYERAVDTAVANVGATTLTAVHHSHTQAAG
jgi:UrcA family protein